MRIDHLIDGKAVAGKDYFETVNPATQEVLAEVAAGGEAEVQAAVAAAKNAFPKWANTPDRKSTRLNSSHLVISYAVFCLKKKKHTEYKGFDGRDGDRLLQYVLQPVLRYRYLPQLPTHHRHH